MIMNKDLISVVIPAYNCQNYIKKCIYSLQMQTYKNIEIIVVDDGSSDQTLSECLKLAKGDHRIVVIDKENAGVSAARNTGLENIHGKYCAFVDADDYVEPVFIEKMFKAISDNHADVCVCGFVDENERGECLHKSEIQFSDLYSTNNLKRKNFVPYVCWQMMFSAKLLSRNGKVVRFNESFSIKEDMLFITDIMVASSKIVVIPDILYHSVIHSGSLTAGLYERGLWNKYKKSIYVYNIALDKTSSVPALQKHVCYETLKESIFMRSHMQKLSINDPEIEDYLVYLRKKCKALFKENTWEIKSYIRMWILIYCPALYLILKKMQQAHKS